MMRCWAFLTERCRADEGYRRLRTEAPQPFAAAAFAPLTARRQDGAVALDARKAVFLC